MGPYTLYDVSKPFLLFKNTKLLVERNRINQKYFFTFIENSCTKEERFFYILWRLLHAYLNEALGLGT